MPDEIEDLTADDRYVELTDNGLRPEDTNLEQPDQDPNVVPQSIVDAEGRTI